MLSDLIRAKIPAIYVKTAEEYRIQEIITDAVRSFDADASVVFWDASGITCYNSEEDSTQEAHTKELRKILDMSALYDILGNNKAAINVFVFSGIHPFLEEERTGQELIYKTSKLIMACKDAGDVVIFVGSTEELPNLLESMFFVCDLPLPSEEDISGLYKSMIMEYVSLTENRSELPALISDVPRASILSQGLTLMEAENALLRSLYTERKIDLRIILKHKADKVAQSDVLELVDTGDLSMDDVIGFSAFKKWLKVRSVAFHKKINSQLPNPKGVLLVGHSGVGKSLIAKATGSLLGLPVIRFEFSRVFRSFLGDSEAMMEKTLRILDAVAPLVVWLDEINLSMGGASSSSVTDSGAMLRLLQMFLTWRQETTKPVFIVATGNSLETLPPMLYRKGRFDNIYFCGLPSTEERKALFSLYCKKFGVSLRSSQYNDLAEVSEGFSGAEIEHSIVDAAYEAEYSGEGISFDLLKKQVQELRPNSRFSQSVMVKTLELFRSVGVLDASTGLPI